MIVKPIKSVLDLAVEEFNKDKMHASKITKTEATEIIGLQFKVLKEYIKRPFYPAISFTGLFTLEVKVSYIRALLYMLIEIMKRARNKGISGEKEYYRAARSFGYWRTLYHKSFIFVKDKNKISHLKWKENAVAKNEIIKSRVKASLPNKRLKLSRTIWDVSNRFIGYEDWINTEEYLKDPLHKRKTWGKNIEVEQFIIDRKRQKTYKKESLNEKGIPYTNHLNKAFLSDSLKINKKKRK